MLFPHLQASFLTTVPCKLVYMDWVRWSRDNINKTRRGNLLTKQITTSTKCISFMNRTVGQQTWYEAFVPNLLQPQLYYEGVFCKQPFIVKATSWNVKFILNAYYPYNNTVNFWFHGPWVSISLMMLEVWENELREQQGIEVPVLSFQSTGPGVDFFWES